jgi:hypothetical protein
MLTKVSFVATALLLSATSVVAQGVSPDFTPGRCSFDAVVTQDCWNNKVNTYVDVSPVYDGGGREFMEQTDFIDLTGGETLTAVVAGKELKIGFERDSMECECHCEITGITRRTDARQSSMATPNGLIRMGTASSAATLNRGTTCRWTVTIAVGIIGSVSSILHPVLLLTIIEVTSPEL